MAAFRPDSTTASAPISAASRAADTFTRRGLAQFVLPLTMAVAVAGFSIAHAQSTSMSDDSNDSMSKDSMAKHSALPEGTVATVNGKPVFAESLTTVMQQFQANNQPVDEARVLDEIINMEVLTQEAEKIGLDKDPDIMAALKLQYVQTMANAYLAKVADDIEVSEEELRAMYDEQAAALDEDEFRASHILLETKEDADNVLKLLAEGREFAELAQEFSTDPAGANGGDLGWFRDGAMVAEFFEAAKAMEVGTTSTAPVKTEFGYHIINLVDKRSGSLPDYETVKEGMTNLAVRGKMNDLMDKLISEADIVR